MRTRRSGQMRSIRDNFLPAPLFLISCLFPSQSGGLYRHSQSALVDAVRVAGARAPLYISSIEIQLRLSSTVAQAKNGLNRVRDDFMPDR